MLKIKEDIISKINERTLVEHRYDNLELKSSWGQDCGKKISALANKNQQGSNWLCVGINNSGEICENNESWAKTTEEIISQHINQYLDPQQVCQSISCHKLNDKWFIIIQFKNPGAVVYWNKKAYKTSGTTISEMEPEEIMGLIVTLPGLSDYTAQDFQGSFQNDLVKKYTLIVSEKRKNSILASLKDLSPEQALGRVGIKNKNTCNILFGNCQYRVVYYDKQQNPINNEPQEGVYRIIHDDFIQHLQEWSKQQLNIRTNPYPDLALREALANAVAHAAYFENNGDIIIEIFPEKISISNLCLHESVYFANKWFSNAHQTINKTLMETLRLSGYVDELGRGKNLIFSESLRYGKKAPQVIIEKSGRFSRWRLLIYGGIQNKAQLKLLGQLRDQYKNEQKALIANALVLWRGQSVANLRQYIEGEAQNLFAEVLRDINGPIFYYKEKDTIVLRRWVKVLLGEGKESKQLTPAEEKDVYEFVKKIRLDYHHGYVSPKDLRDIADLGHTSSSQVMSSQLLKKWVKENKLKKIRKGLYQFIKSEVSYSVEELLKKLNIDTK
jgi:predicted HTH transcriptional regulator